MTIPSEPHKKFIIEEKLDHLLQVIKTGTPFQQDSIERDLGILSDEYERLLNKLKTDNFADKNGKITIEGELFAGYFEKRKRDIISKNLQLIQTWAIAIGTFLAGIYALIQIYNWFFENCN